MTDRVDAVVIGAGIVGLCIARALALVGRDVLVVEAANTIGTGISSRSSEVIHAGLYYGPGSRKARLCTRGRDLLYAYCAENGVAHRRTGKLLVAVDEAQRDALVALQANARACGVDDTTMLDEAALRDLEPAVHGVAALHSPSSGIVDSRGLMLALLGDVERRGGVVAYASAVVGGRVRAGRIALEVRDVRGATESLDAACVVNCAGLEAMRVAQSIGGIAPSWIPALHRAKGHYFAYAGRSPFSRLVYPLPEQGGLGVHATLDLGGGLRFGPDVEWVDERATFDVDATRRVAFERAIRRYWPALPDDGLVPAYAGIRPKLSGPGEPAADFAIVGPRDHAVPGLVHCFGIESPGLTASLAIGEFVAAALCEAP